MATGLLEIGLSEPLMIREERLSSRYDTCRLLYISDIHLRRGRSERLIQQVLDAVHRANADALLLGGDLLDHASQLPHLETLITRLAAVAPVFAIAGNHDSRVGLTVVRDVVATAGGQWIHDGAHSIPHGGRTISVGGPMYESALTGDVQILCAHNPRIWKTSQHAGYDLVLAGHLHGCQLVAFEFRDRLYPGAMFYPYNYLNHQSGKTRLIVSRGVSDLVPVRWRCPREVVLCLV